PALVRAGDLAGAPVPPDVGSILHPAPDGSVVLGASREPHLSDHLLDPEVPREIMRRAIRLVPGLASAAVRAAWWGVRPTTPDERPLVGPVAEGLLAATGHGSEGVILAGGTAELVASLVSGAEPPSDPGPFDPRRFG
ncbi:MAG TPA: FAD-dependent oxidoreductase, partial [Actinomycetota bacterium]|nr:FAD-dependent oxidoreductase [Actinomycetota bacterium]